MTQQNKKQSWEERFDEKYKGWILQDNQENYRSFDIIKTDITHLLASRDRELAERIKSSLKERMMNYDSGDGYSNYHDEMLLKVANDVEDILQTLSASDSESIK